MIVIDPPAGPYVSPVDFDEYNDARRRRQLDHVIEQVEELQHLAQFLARLAAVAPR